MTDLQKAALITGILWGVAAFIGGLGRSESTRISFALWYAGWAVLAITYALQ